MMGLAPQLDIFIAAQTSAQFVQGITAVLTQQNVHLQAVFAYEALGKQFCVSPTLIDQAIGILGGSENVLKTDLMRFFGSKRDDLVTYLRKSTPCIQAFLLTAALRGCHYDMREIAMVLFEILSGSDLLSKFPVSIPQLEQLVTVLLPQIHGVLESFAQCNMLVLTAASDCSDMSDLDMACQQLPPSTMGKILLHGFKAIMLPPAGSIELRGSTGLFEIATIFLWLSPCGKVALSLHSTEAHPSHRTPVLGTNESPLMIQAATTGGWQNHESKSEAMFGWKMVPWMSSKALAANALSWISVAKPMLSGDAGRVGNVALDMAKKWIQ